jgi:hypothetical protein
LDLRIKVDRQVISMSEMAPFGNHKFRVPFDATGEKWVRFAVWDSGEEWRIPVCGTKRISGVRALTRRHIFGVVRHGHLAYSVFDERLEDSGTLKLRFSPIRTKF